MNKFEERLKEALKKQAELSDNMAHGRTSNIKTMNESQINELHQLLIDLEDKVNNGLVRCYENTQKQLIRATQGLNVTITPTKEIEEIKKDIYKIKNHLGFNQSQDELEYQIENLIYTYDLGIVPEEDNARLIAKKIINLLKLNLAGYPANVTRNVFSK